MVQADRKKEFQPIQAVNQEKVSKPSKKWLLIIIYFLLFTIGVTASLGYRFIKFKKDIKTLAGNQKNNFQKLSLKYNEILVLLETIPETNEQEAEPRLSDSLNEKVLGLESNPYIIQTRQLSSLFKESSNLVVDIQEKNQQIRTKLNTPYFKILLPQDNGLIEKTANFSLKSRELLNYLQQSTNLNLKLFNLGIELGASIEDAIYRNADATAIRNLDSKINEVDSLRQDWQMLDVSLLSPAMQEVHNEGTASISEFKNLLTNIRNSLEQKDVQKLVKELQTLLIQSGVEGETASVESIQVWENNQTINSAYSLKTEWEEFYKKLEPLVALN